MLTQGALPKALSRPVCRLFIIAGEKVRLADAENCVELFRSAWVERECAAEIWQGVVGASINANPAASLPRHQTAGIDGEAFFDQQTAKIEVGTNGAGVT